MNLTIMTLMNCLFHFKFDELLLIIYSVLTDSSKVFFFIQTFLHLHLKFRLLLTQKSIFILFTSSNID